MDPIAPLYAARRGGEGRGEAPDLNSADIRKDPRVELSRTKLCQPRLEPKASIDSKK